MKSILVFAQYSVFLERFSRRERQKDEDEGHFLAVSHFTHPQKETPTFLFTYLVLREKVME